MKSLRNIMDKGSPIIGTWTILPSIDLFDIYKNAGFDFIILDMEHGPQNLETVQNFIQIFNGSETHPIVRVPKLDESWVLRILEMGCPSIQVSHISSVQDAQKMVDYVKYYPAGNRGFSPVSRAGGYSYKNEKNHSAIQNDLTSIIINVEDEDGLKNLDAIAKVDEIDVIFLGIYDIAQSIGRPGDIDHPDVIKEAKKAVDTIAKNGKYIGGFARDFDSVENLVELGFNYITYQADAPIINSAFSDLAQNLKSIKNKKIAI